MSLHPGYDDMADMQYREENPGYEREVGLTWSDFGEDCDPDLAMEMAAVYTRDNAARRQNNERTRQAELEAENAELRALLTANGITPPAREEY